MRSHGSALQRVAGVCVRSGLSQAFGAVTQRQVEFRAQRVCRDSLSELLQGAVESTTSWYELILHQTETVEPAWGKTSRGGATVDRMSRVCVIPVQHKTL